VLEIEQFLPDGMRSPSLAACAKRIDQARAAVSASTRKLGEN